MPASVADSRPPRPAPSEESWFGGFNAAPDTQSLIDDSRFAASWQSDAEARLRRGPVAGVASTTFERIYRAFIAARAALGAALVATLGVASVFGLRPSVPIGALSLAYAALAISMWLLPRFRRAARRTPLRAFAARSGLRR